MTNIRNMGSNESLGFNLKKWHMRLTGLKAIDNFLSLQSQDSFESNCPETKFQTTTSERQFE